MSLSFCTLHNNPELLHSIRQQTSTNALLRLAGTLEALERQQIGRASQSVQEHAQDCTHALTSSAMRSKMQQKLLHRGTASITTRQVLTALYRALKSKKVSRVKVKVADTHPLSQKHTDEAAVSASARDAAAAHPSTAQPANNQPEAGGAQQPSLSTQQSASVISPRPSDMCVHNSMLARLHCRVQGSEKLSRFLKRSTLLKSISRMRESPNREDATDSATASNEGDYIGSSPTAERRVSATIYTPVRQKLQKVPGTIDRFMVANKLCFNPSTPRLADHRALPSLRSAAPLTAYEEIFLTGFYIHRLKSLFETLADRFFAQEFAQRPAGDTRDAGAVGGEQGDILSLKILFREAYFLTAAIFKRFFTLSSILDHHQTYILLACILIALKIVGMTRSCAACQPSFMAAVFCTEVEVPAQQLAKAIAGAERYIFERLGSEVFVESPVDVMLRHNAAILTRLFDMQQFAFLTSTVCISKRLCDFKTASHGLYTSYGVASQELGRRNSQHVCELCPDASGSPGTVKAAEAAGITVGASLRKACAPALSTDLSFSTTDGACMPSSGSLIPHTAVTISTDTLLPRRDDAPTQEPCLQHSNCSLTAFASKENSRTSASISLSLPCMGDTNCLSQRDGHSYVAVSSMVAKPPADSLGDAAGASHMTIAVSSNDVDGQAQTKDSLATETRGSNKEPLSATQTDQQTHHSVNEYITPVLTGGRRKCASNSLHLSDMASSGRVRNNAVSPEGIVQAKADGIASSGRVHEQQEFSNAALELQPLEVDNGCGHNEIPEHADRCTGVRFSVPLAVNTDSSVNSISMASPVGNIPLSRRRGAGADAIPEVKRSPFHAASFMTTSSAHMSDASGAQYQPSTSNCSSAKRSFNFLEGQEGTADAISSVTGERAGAGTSAGTGTGASFTHSEYVSVGASTSGGDGDGGDARARSGASDRRPLRSSGERRRQSHLSGAHGADPAAEGKSGGSQCESVSFPDSMGMNLNNRASTLDALDALDALDEALPECSARTLAAPLANSVIESATPESTLRGDMLRSATFEREAPAPARPGAAADTSLLGDLSSSDNIRNIFADNLPTFDRLVRRMVDSEGPASSEVLEEGLSCARAGHPFIVADDVALTMHTLRRVNAVLRGIGDRDTRGALRQLTEEHLSFYGLLVHTVTLYLDLFQGTDLLLLFSTDTVLRFLVAEALLLILNSCPGRLGAESRAGGRDGTVDSAAILRRDMYQFVCEALADGPPLCAARGERCADGGPCSCPCPCPGRGPGSGCDFSEAAPADGAAHGPLSDRDSELLDEYCGGSIAGGTRQGAARATPHRVSQLYLCLLTVFYRRDSYPGDDVRGSWSEEFAVDFWALARGAFDGMLRALAGGGSRQSIDVSAYSGCLTRLHARLETDTIPRLPRCQLMIKQPETFIHSLVTTSALVRYQDARRHFKALEHRLAQLPHASSDRMDVLRGMEGLFLQWNTADPAFFEESE